MVLNLLGLRICGLCIPPLSAQSNYGEMSVLIGDSRIWCPSPNGRFTSKSFFHILASDSSFDLIFFFLINERFY